MRAILLSALAVASAASAAPPTGYDIVMAPYFKELRRQCPEKHLELLAPADLNFVLEGLKPKLTTDQQARMARAERSDCAHSIAGVSCLNVGDFRVAGRSKLVPKLAASVCASFKACVSQSNCT